KKITFESFEIETLDIVHYRVYKLVVKIASMSEESLNYCTDSGLVPQLLQELTGDDILVRVTCAEMITSLASSAHGRRYLLKQGIIDNISNMILGADSDLFSGFYLPGLVKFFGNLAVMDKPHQICEHYPAFLEKVFSMTEGNEPTMIGVAVDTLGVLGSNLEGKQVLHKTGTKYQKVFRRLGHHAKSSNSDLRVRCLDTIPSLMFFDNHTEDLLAMAESWFSALSDQLIDLFRSIVTQPFHCTTLKVFTAIANQPWAQKLMISSPGFVEYVIDRNSSAVWHRTCRQFAKIWRIACYLNSRMALTCPRSLK
uniref:26S proteasome non-ATPase regulatory subunit 5 n=1 Tax=Leptobrachium leishanense TaxID=445787 RepID=A0A8C5PJW0_9ANUR